MPWAFISAALLEGGLAFATSRFWVSPDIAAPVAKSMVIVLVGFGLWQNRHLRGMWLVALGLLSNSLVMLANGGHMPVSEAALEQAGMQNLLPSLMQRSDAVHSLMQPNTPLWFLGDIIPVHIWGYQNVISLGDVYLMLGVWLVVLEGSMQAKARRERKAFEFELEF